MKPIPSILSTDPQFAFRDALFTDWMSAELLQLQTEMDLQIGMIALYGEHDPLHGFRQIRWNPGKRIQFEARSGRSFEDFEAMHHAGVEQGRQLATLHISQKDVFSAVWLDQSGIDAAAPVLEALGISRPEIRE